MPKIQNKEKGLNKVKTWACTNTCGDLLYLPGVLSLKLTHTEGWQISNKEALLRQYEVWSLFLFMTGDFDNVFSIEKS